MSLFCTRTLQLKKLAIKIHPAQSYTSQHNLLQLQFCVTRCSWRVRQTGKQIFVGSVHLLIALKLGLVRRAKSVWSVAGKMRLIEHSIGDSIAGPRLFVHWSFGYLSQERFSFVLCGISSALKFSKSRAPFARTST